jgi:hypothetical protein
VNDTGSWEPLVNLLTPLGQFEPKLTYVILEVSALRIVSDDTVNHSAYLFNSACQRQCELLPSLGVRSMLSVNFSHFNLLLWNPQPNELKRGRKHLWKVLCKICLFCPDPLTNMVATGNSFFWLADWKKSSPLKPLSQMNRNLVGSIYVRSSIKNAHFVPIG